MITNRNQYKNILLFLALITLMVISVSPVMAADGDALADSQFPKAQNDNQNTGQSQYVGPQSNNTTGNYTPDQENTRITGAPSIGPDGTVYLPTQFRNGSNYLANLYALTPDGTKKWNYTIYDGISTNSYNLFTGSPAITKDGTIYITGEFYDGTRTYGFLYALNPDGTFKWKYILNDGLTVYMRGSPAIGADGTIYFSSSYLNDGWNAKLNAIKSDGTLKWGYSVSQGDYGGNIASPAIGTDGTIYFAYMYYDEGSRAILDLLDQNGNKLWTGSISGTLASSALVVREGIVYMVVDDTLYARNPAQDRTEWTYTIINGRFSNDPAVAKDGTIYIGGYYQDGDGYNYGLYALNPDGSLKWSYPTMYNINHEAVIGADGTIYFGEGDLPDTFFALNRDGTLKWSLPVTVRSSVAIGSNGYLYFGVTDGQKDILYIVQTARSDPDNTENTTTENTTVSAATTTKSSGKSIGMQKTGLPLPLMVLAVLMVLGGLISTRKN